MALPQKQVPRIDIECKMAGDDPLIAIYEVEITMNDGSWRETWGSREHLQAFLRGMEAGAWMSGGIHIPIPEIPRPPS